MSYRYRSDITFADAAFECEGASLEDIFVSAVDALTNLMVEDLSNLRRVIRKSFRFEAAYPAVDECEELLLARLLVQVLEKLIYLKDVEGLLLRAQNIKFEINAASGRASIDATLVGEPIDAARHELGSDVKAVTHHQLRVWREGGHWKALVVVDI